MDGRQNHFTGAANELRAASLYIDMGYEVFIPVMTQSKADFIALRGSEVVKVQVKTASEITSDNKQYLQIRLQGRSSTGGGTREYVDGDIDVVVAIHRLGVWALPWDSVRGKKSLTFGRLVDGKVISRQKGFTVDEYKIH